MFFTSGGSEEQGAVYLSGMLAKRSGQTGERLVCECDR